MSRHSVVVVATKWKRPGGDTRLAALPKQTDHHAFLVSSPTDREPFLSTLAAIAVIGSLPSCAPLVMKGAGITIR